MARSDQLLSAPVPAGRCLAQGDVFGQGFT
jgi:hypothetical protein